ncbi:MAG: type II toxin-antitoxin system VapB family antitoxin [Terracidiphilus sp.]
MAGTITSIRLDTKLADEAAEALGVKTRTEAVNLALKEIVALKRFKAVLIQYGGKGEFAGSDE